MTSILTNTEAMAALATMRSIDTNMEKTQGDISTGLRISQASDNAAYWSIATTMKSDNAALSTVQDALGLGAAKADTTYAGLDQTVNLLTQIKAKLVAAKEPGVDKDKVQKEITELKNQLISVASAASFSGENWLYNTSTSANGVKTMVGGFTRLDGSTISVQTISFDTSKSTLIDTKVAANGLLTQNTSGGGAINYCMLKIVAAGTTPPAGGTTEIIITSATTDATLGEMSTAVEAMLKSVIDVSTTLGAVSSRLDNQKTFMKSISDTITKGIGRLVDADMNEESTRLKALQTQQQLTIQSLSIANGNAQALMQLFR